MGQRFLTEPEAAEYRQILQSYHPNGQVVFDFAKSRFGTLDGPTGAGKDTLRTKLLSNYPDLYSIVLSTTSRPLRDGETDGVQYHFRDLDYIQVGLDERRFLQAELIHDQQISGLDFGDVEALNPAHFGVAILNVEAVKGLRKLNPDMKTVFVVPPSYEELMRRLDASRSMKLDEVNRRLLAAETELTTALKDEAYYLVTNDDLDRCIKLIHDYYQIGQVDSVEEERTKEVINKLLNALSSRSA